jgi:hypothetical protein
VLPIHSFRAKEQAGILGRLHALARSFPSLRCPAAHYPSLTSAAPAAMAPSRLALPDDDPVDQTMREILSDILPLRNAQVQTWTQCGSMDISQDNNNVDNESETPKNRYDNFVFCGSLDTEHEYAEGADEEGAPTTTVEANTKHHSLPHLPRMRQGALNRFKAYVSPLGPPNLLTDVHPKGITRLPTACPAYIKGCYYDKYLRALIEHRAWFYLWFEDKRVLPWDLLDAVPQGTEDAIREMTCVLTGSNDLENRRTKVFTQSSYCRTCQRFELLEFPASSLLTLALRPSKEIWHAVLKNQDGLENSHLCHIGRCMLPRHIVREAHFVNLNRERCAQLLYHRARRNGPKTAASFEEEVATARAQCNHQPQCFPSGSLCYNKSMYEDVKVYMFNQS